MAWCWGNSGSTTSSILLRKGDGGLLGIMPMISSRSISKTKDKLDIILFQETHQTNKGKTLMPIVSHQRRMSLKVRWVLRVGLHDGERATHADHFPEEGGGEVEVRRVQDPVVHWPRTGSRVARSAGAAR